MDDSERLLLDNLKETARVAQIYLLGGIGTALFLLLLAIQGQLAEGAKENQLVIPGIGLQAPTFTAAVISLIIYILSGIIAISLVKRFEEIKRRLEKNAALLNAALTYPSWLTASREWQLVGALLPAAIGMLALIVAFYPSQGIEKSIWTAILFSFPYPILAFFIIRGAQPSKS